MKTRLMFAVLGLVVISAPLAAQEAIQLYPGPAPGTEDWTFDVGEKEYFSKIFNTEVVTNVSQPTLTPYLPDPDKANGTAVIIAPGGGFHALSINSEGIDVAKWLNERGVAGFVLRYRLVPTGEDGVKDMMAKAGNREQIDKDMASVVPFAGADGLAAVRYVRENAEKFGVTPDRIGFMGFSAGGGVTAFVAFNGEAESRANFLAPIYAGLGNLDEAEVPKNAPPLFVVAATDDQLDLAKESVVFYNMWLEAKRPAELHIYSKGGHGFGMKTQNLPSDTWIDRFGEWLDVQGLLDLKTN